MILLGSAIVLLWFIQGFFSSSEIALISCDVQLLKKNAKKNDRKSKLALSLLKFPERILVLSLLGVNICSVSSSSLVFKLISEYFPNDNPYFFSILISAVGIVLFGELIPKSLAQRFSIEWTRMTVDTIWVLQKGMYPVLLLVSFYANSLKKIFGGTSDPLASPKLSSKEIRGLIRDTKDQQTDLLFDEIEIISNILDLSDVKAVDIMTPLVNFKSLDENHSLAKALEECKKNIQHSKFPVYRERIDNVVGFIKTVDTLENPRMDVPVKSVMHKPTFVSEFQTLKQIFSAFQTSATEMVFVVDEYGGVIGLLTIEDLMEEVIGEINDEFDKDDIKSKIYPKNNGFIVVASTSYETVLEYLGLKLSDHNFEAESIGGVIIEKLGKIPLVSENIVLNYNLYCEIVEVSAKKIDLIFVKILDESAVDHGI